MDLQDIQDNLLKLAQQENLRDVLLLLKMDYSNEAYTCFTVNTEGIDYLEREKYSFRKAIIQSQEEVLQIYPEYYQGLILLSLMYYEIKEYHIASKLAHTAHELIKKLGVENNKWLDITTSLFDLGMEFEGTYLNYFDNKNLDIRKIKAKRDGNILYCSECSTFNPKNTKKCLKCNKKLNKKTDDITKIEPDS